MLSVNIWVMLHIFFTKYIATFFRIWQRKIKNWFIFSFERILLRAAHRHRHFSHLWSWLNTKIYFAHMHCAYFSLQKCFNNKKSLLDECVCKIYIIAAFLHNSKSARAKKIEMRINCGQCVWTFSTYSSIHRVFEIFLCLSCVAVSRHQICENFMSELAVWAIIINFKSILLEAFTGIISTPLKII